MQNTLVRGERNEKGERKKEENKGGKGLKNAPFWAINSPRPPQTYLSGKKLISKEGGGNDQNAQDTDKKDKLGKKTVNTWP